MTNVEIESQIIEEVAGDLFQLPAGLRHWAEHHLVKPRRVMLSTDARGNAFRTFWLVTDHSGSNDAPCRVVFDGVAFGLAVTLDSGVECFVGPIGSFAKTVQKI